MYCFCVLMLWLHCMPYRLKLKLICYILLLYRPLSLYYFMSLYWNITCKIMPLKTWNWIKIDRERPIERERECARVLVRARERESARVLALVSRACPDESRILIHQLRGLLLRRFSFKTHTGISEHSDFTRTWRLIWGSAYRAWKSRELFSTLDSQHRP